MTFLLHSLLFSPIPSGWKGGQMGCRMQKVYLGCISESIRCRKLILGRDIGLRDVGVQPQSATLI